MHFNDKQKKIISGIIAVAMLVPLAISIVGMFISGM